MSKILTAIGLMSGTSLDGIDAAILETDGVTISKRYSGVTVPYSENFRKQIKEIILGNGDVKKTEEELTHMHADAVAKLLDKTGIAADDIDVVGFHGQTIDHRPDESVTVQIGDGELLAELTGINVVNNFRIDDVKQGGQGAPLVPVYHAALVASEKLPVAIFNIGGVANVTWIGAGENDIISFDTGPGNALLDDWVLQHTGQSCDEGGKIAASGNVDDAILQNLMDHSYFAKPPPKSLDRNEFANDVTANLSVEDGAATLSEFTANSIFLATQHFPQRPKYWYITGGGRNNDYMMSRLALYSNGVPVLKIEELGYDGDMLEAEAFAFLAVRSLNKMALTFPSTTGVRQAQSGGVFCQA